MMAVSTRVDDGDTGADFASVTKKNNTHTHTHTHTQWGGGGGGRGGEGGEKKEEKTHDGTGNTVRESGRQD